MDVANGGPLRPSRSSNCWNDGEGVCEELAAMSENGTTVQTFPSVFCLSN